jgi:hypothetical protein
MSDPYRNLERVLLEAKDQAASGKGKERHATDEPYEQQPIMAITRRFIGNPAGPLLYQTVKKTYETTRLLKMDNGFERAIAELRGAINYAAAGILLLEELAIAADRLAPVQDSGIANIGQNIGQREEGDERKYDCKHCRFFNPTNWMMCGTCLKTYHPKPTHWQPKEAA